MGQLPQGALNTVSAADVSQKLGTKQTDAYGADLLSVALIGPHEERRAAVAKALDETRQVNTREFDSYPPESEHMQRLLTSFDVLILDLDSDPEVAVRLVEQARARNEATIMVYSENPDPKLAVRLMRAGASEYLLLPLEQGAMAEALVRSTNTNHEQPIPGEKGEGKLLVFAGSKGGSGVTTMACNVAIALAQNSDQKTLLIDLALPIGDAALCLGIAAGYSTDDALRNIDRLDATFLQNLLVKHRSGVFVLAAPTKIPEIEVSNSAIVKLMAIARREFDHVIVDVGSRIDVAAKVLFEDASRVYLVTQTGISELRNSNRLISQFFAEESPSLEVVINRFDSRFHETTNEDVVAKALGRPVRWKIPNDQDAARALQYGDTGLSETGISRISLEMASSITGRPIPQDRKRDYEPKSPGKSAAQADAGKDDYARPANLGSDHARATPVITWPTPEPIAYGNKLTFAQLNATASVDGTFVYTPGPGYVLPVGTHTLWVTFTPTDLGGYLPFQSAISIVVTRATPHLSWPTPADIIYGKALDDAQLNASASVPGKLEYSPAAGEVLTPGPHALSVRFTPTDGTNYTTAEATVPIAVARAASAIQWPTPDAISYGTHLRVTQLCATASVPGTFEYNPGLGAVLAAGEHKLSLSFTPTDRLGYSISHCAVSLTVAKAAPVITWPSPDPIAQGVALSATQLQATASVPGIYTYRPAAGEILAPGVHELSVIFTPTDTLNYSTVSAAVTLTVTEKPAATITWPVPSPISYGTALSAIQLNATTPVPGTFVYTPAAGLVLAPGKYILAATFTPSDTENYATAQASVVLEVQGPPETDSSPVAAAAAPAEPAPKWTFTETNIEAADPARPEGTDERTETKTNPPETRVYKGAVYEKGEDGKWHLQKK